MLNNKKNGIGIGSILLVTLAVILCTVVYAIISSLICNLLISARFSGVAACAILPNFVTLNFVAFVIYEALFIFISLVKKEAFGDKSTKLKRISRILVPLVLLATLLLAVINANTFTRIDEDSIDKVCFVEYKSYSWEDKGNIARYTLSCDSNGVLSYTLTMKDGERIDLLSGVLSSSDEFAEKFGNIAGYAAYLSEELEKSDYIVEGRIIGVEYMEKFYKESRPETWVHLEKIISLGGES